jgi:uncharacterized protein
MKIINFIIFFSVFLTVYGLVNFYIFIHGRQALLLYPELKTPYLVLFLFFALSYIIGRVLERLWLSAVSDVFVWIGSFWLALFFYFLLVVVVIDLARLVNYVVPFFHFLAKDYTKLKLATLLVSISVVLVIVFSGYINACSLHVRQVNITIAKKSNVRELKIVAASDIHLGTIVGRKRFCRIVNKINALAPDLILLPGDIVDEDLAPVIRENLGEALLKLQAKFGIYAVTGNHEFIGGVEPAVAYLQQHGATMLRDRVVKLDCGVYLVGREDRSSRQFSGRTRKNLPELMNGIDKTCPIILLDHQPFGLEEAEENGVDLQLSGHTHHGQFWPLNYITKAIYEDSWGYLKKGDTYVYVSCGAGTWGAPVRLGSRAEIVQINLTFNELEAHR